MAKGEIFHPRREVGWRLHQKVQALDNRSHRLEPQELMEEKNTFERQRLVYNFSPSI